MTEKEQAIAKDKILGHCIKYHTTTKTPYAFVSAGIIADINWAERLIFDIHDHGDDIARVHIRKNTIIGISKSGFTENFLNTGGFEELHNQNVKREKRKQKQNKRQDKLLAKELELTQLNITADERNQDNTRKVWRATIVNIVIGILNIIAMLFIAFYSKSA